MNWKERLKTMAKSPFFNRYTPIGVVWAVAAVAAALLKYPNNNFNIFRHVFWHVWQGLPLYTEYPEAYHDVNLYGPLFGCVVTPFAVWPAQVGLALWLLAMTGLLFVAVRRLPMERQGRLFVAWFCANELFTALCLAQFNVAIAALLILSFVWIEEDHEVWAALMIVVGTFVKIYGVVGLAFFFFVRRKGRFLAALAGWSAVCFVLPMLLSSPGYVVGQYGEWMNALAAKSEANLFALYQNISLPGMVRKISGWADYSDLWIIVPGMVLFALPYLRRSQYRYPAFRLMFLASVMLFVVLFSTGSESSGYIIALTGVAIWYKGVPWRRNRWDMALLVFAFVLTSLSPSDLFPRSVFKRYVLPYALKALPCVLVWLKLTWEMMTCCYELRTTSDKSDERPPLVGGQRRRSAAGCKP